VAAAAPVLFAAPVLYALIASFGDVVGTSHPFFGDISGTVADARSVSLGVPLYQDPNVGYTPLSYTPLMSVLGGGLDLIKPWDGWLMVLTILADAGLVAVAAVLAYRRIEDSRAGGLAALAGAAGMGAIAFWLVGFVPFNTLYVPRPDQLAWAFALTGLVLVPAAANGSVRSGVAAVCLLSLGWWTKQPALVPAVAASVWLALASFRRTLPARTCVILIGTIVATGVLSFALVHLLTDGWSTTFVVDIPADRPQPVSLGTSIHDFVVAVAPAAVVAAALWIAAALGRDTPEAGGSLAPRPSSALRVGLVGIAGVLGIFVIVDTPASLFFRQAVGSTHNQFMGIAWALTLLAACGWNLVQRGRAPASVAAGAVVLALFAVSEISLLPRWLHKLDVVVPAKEQRALVFNQPAALVDYARGHLVYHPGYAGIGADSEAEIYPDQFNVNGLNRAGGAAGYLERGLLGRRFDLVYPFSGNGDAGPWEANYFWKLNQVIAAKYEPSDTLPSGLSAARIVASPFAPFVAGPPMLRRPGPDPAAWMDHCFAPFRLRGASWRIASGGGFWCRPGGQGDALRLIGTPAPVSEIRADAYTAPSAGTILVTAPAGGMVSAEIGDRSIRARIGPGRPAQLLVPEGAHGISIRVSASSHATVDLGRLSGV